MKKYTNKASVTDKSPKLGTKGAKRQPSQESKRTKVDPEPKARKPKQPKPKAAKAKRKVTVRVGSSIWDTLDGFFLIFNLIARIWKRINGNDDSL